MWIIWLLISLIIFLLHYIVHTSRHLTLSALLPFFTCFYTHNLLLETFLFIFSFILLSLAEKLMFERRLRQISISPESIILKHCIVTKKVSSNKLCPGYIKFNHLYWPALSIGKNQFKKGDTVQILCLCGIYAIVDTPFDKEET